MVKACSISGLHSQRVIVIGLAAVLLLAFIAVPQAFAQVPEAGAYENISVDTAYDMITSGSFPNLVILDVRNQSEYDLGHLYDAILIPYYQLDTRIGELEEHANDEIIVYCARGYRSQIACEILVSHSFTKVYNVLGGILAWIEAGYPIYTTYHYVTVDIVDEEILLQIEPLLLHLKPVCISCTQNQTCPSSTPSNVTFAVLEQDESHTTILVTYEVNGTTLEATITKTLLWSYNELTDEANRTARFISTEITTGDVSIQSYSLSYLVRDVGYNLVIHTNLALLNSETYHSSFTIVSYAADGKSEQTSLEFVEFNSSVTLSQHYAILGKVAKKLGKVYEKSEDVSLAQLAEGYYTMKKEAKYLSKLVKKQLAEYDREILKSSAILMDDECGFVCGTICGLMGILACTVIAGAYCTFYAWICYPICTIAWSFGCAVACSWACSGFQYVSPCDVGCNVFCGIFASAICSQLGWLGGGICEILSIPICEGICWAVCG